MHKTKNFCIRLISVALSILMLITLCSCADLVVRNIHSASFLTTSRKIKATVKNVGSQTAPASTISIEKAVDPAGPYTPAGTISTPSLASGEEKELDLMLDPGDCIHLKVCADSNGDVNEGLAGENNNCSMKSIGCP